MKAIITVGMGFGDEGKGAAVDYLVRKHKANLVVRYSGGHQAAHNVVTPEGKHHTFSQFGSGTLAGAGTFLAADVVIEPLAMIKEAEHLQKLGIDPWHRMYISPHCLVTTIYHKLLNRKNSLKGETCGVGVGETRKYYLKYGQDAIFMDDLNRESIVLKLDLLKARILDEIYEERACGLLGNTDFGKQILSISTNQVVRDLMEIHDYIEPYVPDLDTRNGVLIFEGSQGLLLDPLYGYKPDVTWGNVTISNALELIDVCKWPTEVIGVTRSYLTRHGDGPFPFDNLSAVEDKYNVENEWQGKMRFAQLHPKCLNAAKQSIEDCGAKLDGLFVNHLDQHKIDLGFFKDIAPVKYVGYGPSSVSKMEN